MVTHSIDRLADSSQNVSVSRRIVESVANERGVDPETLPLLYHAIDPDALDALFGARRTRWPFMGELAFQYAGYDITVSYDGELSLTLDETARTDPESPETVEG